MPKARKQVSDCQEYIMRGVINTKEQKGTFGDNENILYHEYSGN